MQVIITTVGTSLLSNRERPWAGWRFGSPLPESGVVDGWLADADPVVAGEGAALLRKLAAEDYLPRSQVANLLKGDGRLDWKCWSSQRTSMTRITFAQIFWGHSLGDLQRSGIAQDPIPYCA